jgi:ABC-type bacteriocin/lantibiotic exporter with double-glycine peptidase domain
MQTFKKLLFLLSSHERKRAILLLIMIIIMAFLDMLGVASILPFMLVLVSPDLIETNFFLNTVFQITKVFGVENNQQFLFVLGILVFVLLIISLTFKAITTFAQVHFVQMREYSIGRRLVEGYLHQPYSWFLNRNSSDLGKTILSEVQQVIGSGMYPLMNLISQAIISIGLIVLLILVNPKLIFLIFILFVSAYGLIYKFYQKLLNRIGEQRLISNELRFLAIGESFGAAKEVKIGGLEQNYIKRFSNAAYAFAKNQASANVISLLPRYVIEAMAFGSVILIILFLMSQTGDFNNAIPVISLYVYAGYRLIPAFQQIYYSFTLIAFVEPSLNKLLDDIKNLKPFNLSQNQDTLSLKTAITLKNIYYNYPNTSRPVLKNISLTIPAKSKVGIVGTTGCGKTTIVDIILGLLEAQKGILKVDNEAITKKNSRAWRKCVGYVPQHIYLSDDTIAANIAFGIEPKYINKKQVIKASKIAKLHNFVINELPKKYQTIIGERGVRLSGGQRQRIGIARALYHNPKVLVLDEATSALDNRTEKYVIDALNNLDKDMTVILIAHRINTLRFCDIIFEVNKGRLVGEETFNQLIKKLT